MTPFEAYKAYLAIKQHFTTKSYDYAKYNGAVGAKETTFESRKDKWFFHKLSKRPDVLTWLVSNHVDRDKAEWIGELINDKDSDKICARWQGRDQARVHHMQEQLRSIDFSTPNSIMVSNGDYPSLLTGVIDKKVTIDTLVILDDELQFLEYWDKRIADTIMWPAIKFKVQKARTFVLYDVDDIQKMLSKNGWVA